VLACVIFRDNYQPQGVYIRPLKRFGIASLAVHRGQPSENSGVALCPIIPVYGRYSALECTLLTISLRSKSHEINVIVLTYIRMYGNVVNKDITILR